MVASKITTPKQGHSTKSASASLSPPKGKGSQSERPPVSADVTFLWMAHLVEQIQTLGKQNRQLVEQVTAPPPFMKTQPLGLAVSIVVTEPPTDDNPYQFKGKLPNGEEITIEVGEEAWVTRQSNLDEGVSPASVSLLPGKDSRESVAKTVAGTKGQLFLARGQMHVHPANATATNPQGYKFQANEIIMPGSTPGEYRQDDPAYFSKMAVAFALDHLQRIFPKQVETINGSLVLKAQPTMESWMCCTLTLYGFDGTAIELPEGSPKKDVGAFARVLFDLLAAYQLSGDQNLLSAAMKGLEAHRQLFEVKAGDDLAPSILTGHERLFKANEKELGSQVSDDVVVTSKGQFHALPAYLQAYAIAAASEAYAVTQDKAALESIVGTMLSYQKYFRAVDGKGWNRAIIPDAQGLGHPSDERLGDLADHKPWNGLDMVVASGLKFGAALGAPKKGEDALMTEGRRVNNEIIFEGSEVITEQMFKEGRPFVDELLRADGSAITNFRWQQNRAVVGHNYKIAWNLQRISSHLQTQAQYCEASGDLATAAKYRQRAARCEEVSQKVYDMLRSYGFDERNGAVLNVVNKRPGPGLESGQPWGANTDFWHQEQGLLAALTLYGKTKNPQYLEDARRIMMIWSEGFLDLNSQSVNFTIALNDVLSVERGDKAYTGRADLGYHQGELAMLANFYNQLFVLEKPASVHFHRFPERASEEVSVRVDAVPPGKYELGEIRLNGELYTPKPAEKASLQFTLPKKWKGREVDIVATIQPVAQTPVV